MASSPTVASPAVASLHPLQAGTRQAGHASPQAVLAVVALTVLGAVPRVIVAHQSVFADELSTYWISAQHSLHGVLSLMYGTGAIKHAEITPPLYFLLAWATSQLGHAPMLLRLASLVAGVLTVPAV